MCRRVAVSVAIAVLVSASSARAQSGQPGPEGEEEDARLDPRRTEFGVLPALSYDSDLGFGLGAITSVVKFYESYDPYRWRLEALLFATLKKAPGGGVELPHHDDYLKVDLPGLLDGALRLQLRVGFARRITTGYYGIGNASEHDASLTEAVPRFYQYRHTNPAIDVKARIPMLERDAGSLELTLRTAASYAWVDPYEDSKLARDLAGDAGTAVQRLLVGTSDHGELLGGVGILWDGRDHESAPQNGMLHELSVRAGGGLGEAYGYAGVTADLRLYVSLYREYLVLATRAYTDWLFGGPPLSEMGLGGAKEIRGVRANRFRGNVTLLGNLELRSKLLPFEIGAHRFNLGALAFADAGRVWSEVPANEALDGNGLGLAAGVGGGLRLQWGEHFILRADFGYSPTEGTTGLYIDVGHVF